MAATKKKKTSQEFPPATEEEQTPETPSEPPAADETTEPPDADTTADAKASEEAAPEAETPAGDEDLRDRLLRLRADFDNYRKRTQRERTDIAQRANDDLFTELFTVLDHFEMGLATARQQETEEAVYQGFQLVYDQLLGLLKKAGVDPIDAEGHAFDPNLHEAITLLPSEEHPAETVMTQTRRGYRRNDQLLRPAQVVVSSGPAQESSDTD